MSVKIHDPPGGYRDMLRLSFQFLYLLTLTCLGLSQVSGADRFIHLNQGMLPHKIYNINNPTWHFLNFDNIFYKKFKLVLFTFEKREWHFSFEIQHLFYRNSTFIIVMGINYTGFATSTRDRK